MILSFMEMWLQLCLYTRGKSEGGLEVEST